MGKHTSVPVAKPVKLQINTSGAWKDVARFDVTDEERTDAIMNAAAQLADAANEGEERPQFTMRIVTDDAFVTVLMRYVGIEGGWRDSRTGAPA